MDISEVDARLEEIENKLEEIEHVLGMILDRVSNTVQWDGGNEIWDTETNLI